MPAFHCPNCLVKSNIRTVWGQQFAARHYAVFQCDNCAGFTYASAPVGITPGSDSQTDVHYPVVRHAAPADYPDAVREEFSEALRSLNTGNPKAAVMMTRSALQAATRALQANGANLKQEIDDLAARHLIPISIQDWAHEIRDGGNLAAHPEPDKRISREDAEELLALAESLFEFLYVVPADVARRRLRTAIRSDG